MRSIRPGIQRALISATICAAVAVPGGCALVAVGAVGAAGGLAYTEGRERRTFAVDIDVAWDAVVAGVQDRGIEVTNQVRTPGSGEITGRWGKDRETVRVFVKAVGSGSTMVAVRVGAANQSKNLELMRHIEYAMPAGTPPSKAYK